MITTSISDGKVGPLGRLSLFILLMMMAAGVQGQSIRQTDLDPNYLFDGFMLSFQASWIHYPRVGMRYEEGFHHRYWNRISSGLGIGVNAHYYFNKRWSVEAGLEYISPQKIKYAAQLDRAKYFYEYSDDPEVLDIIISYGIQSYVEEDRLNSKINIPVMVGYHLYPGQKQRNGLDLKVGVALVKQITPYDLSRNRGTILGGRDTSIYVPINTHEIDMSHMSSVYADLQGYFGYRRILKNHRSVTFGLKADISFKKGQYPSKVEHLAGTSYYGRSALELKGYSMAIQLAYQLTFPRRKYPIRQKPDDSVIPY